MIEFFIGVDPGLQGAIALINGRGNFLAVYDAPTVKVKKSNGGNKNTYIVSEMWTILETLVRAHNASSMHAIIEYQASRPGQGAPATFSQGYGYGLWTMALAAAHVPYEIVQPRAWKKFMGIPAGSDKGASIVMASQLFPHAPITTPRGREIDGRAESLILAEYLRRKRNT